MARFLVFLDSRKLSVSEVQTCHTKSTYYYTNYLNAPHLRQTSVIVSIKSTFTCSKSLLPGFAFSVVSSYRDISLWEGGRLHFHIWQEWRADVHVPGAAIAEVTFSFIERRSVV